MRPCAATALLTATMSSSSAARLSSCKLASRACLAVSSRAASSLSSRAVTFATASFCFPCQLLLKVCSQNTHYNRAFTPGKYPETTASSRAGTKASSHRVCIDVYIRAPTINDSLMRFSLFITDTFMQSVREPERTEVMGERRFSQAVFLEHRKRRIVMLTVGNEAGHVTRRIPRFAGGSCHRCRRN